MEFRYVTSTSLGKEGLTWVGTRSSDNGKLNRWRFGRQEDDFENEVFEVRKRVSETVYPVTRDNWIENSARVFPPPVVETTTRAWRWNKSLFLFLFLEPREISYFRVRPPSLPSADDGILVVRNRVMRFPNAAAPFSSALILCTVAEEELEKWKCVVYTRWKWNLKKKERRKEKENKVGRFFSRWERIVKSRSFPTIESGGGGGSLGRGGKEEREGWWLKNRGAGSGGWTLFPGRAFVALFRGLNYHGLVAAAAGNRKGGGKKILKSRWEMPRDKNRPRPFRGTFSFHLPAAKELLLLLLLVVTSVSTASPPVTFSTRIIPDPSYRIFRLPSFFVVEHVEPHTHTHVRMLTRREKGPTRGWHGWIHPVLSPWVLFLFIDDLLRSSRI